MAERLLDRLEDCKRTFPSVAVLGGAGEAIVSRLRGGRAGIESAVLLDSSHAMLERCRQQVSIGTALGRMSQGIFVRFRLPSYVARAGCELPERLDLGHEELALLMLHVNCRHVISLSEIFSDPGVAGFPAECIDRA